MQFICSFLSLSLETSTGAGCTGGIYVINTLERFTCLCLFLKATRCQQLCFTSDLLSERLSFEHAKYPVADIQTVICWGEFVFGLVEFLGRRKILLLKLLLFQTATQKANICMWFIEMKWYNTCTWKKAEHCGINMIMLQHEVDVEINL